MQVLKSIVNILYGSEVHLFFLSYMISYRKNKFKRINYYSFDYNYDISYISVFVDQLQQAYINRY